MADFLWLALLAGLGIALVAGPLGSYVVWRRMAYFGDTLAHSALLGVALGLLFQMPINLSVIAVCLLLASALVFLQQQKMIAADTLLGILAHSSLALGLVVVSLLPGVRLDLMAYLFGDLLAVTRTDLIWIYSSVVFVFLLLFKYWDSLLAITLHEELAQVEGINTTKIKLILMLMMALIIAIAMKIVGVLLITSLMIIPAASARRFARTPEMMAVCASLIGCIAVGLGLFASVTWDTPAGPSIVLSAGLLFLVLNVVSKNK
jgi:zinc transport system permease protein